jgi:valyl-tRNA synthetase
MPFVTEEIYSMLPIKEQESIMLETYPKYDKKLIFKDEMLAVEEVLKDIVAIRNLKANNKITKEAKLTLNISDENFKSIYFQQLKINAELIIDNPSTDLTASNYKSKYIDITYYTETEPVDTKALEEEIKKLEASIARRQNLLSNENYVNKAPANIVEMDRKKLEEEQEKLANLKAQM